VIRYTVKKIVTLSKITIMAKRKRNPCIEPRLPIDEGESGYSEQVALPPVPIESTRTEAISPEPPRFEELYAITSFNGGHCPNCNMLIQRTRKAFKFHLDQNCSERYRAFIQRDLRSNRPDSSRFSEEIESRIISERKRCRYSGCNMFAILGQDTCRVHE